MPIYEYQCESCGHNLEALQRLSDDPLMDCPVCAKPALKKQISAAGFRLKGGGWYETDFKSGNKKNLAGDSSGSGSSSGGNAAPSTGTSSAPAAATSATKTKAAE